MGEGQGRARAYPSPDAIMNPLTPEILAGTADILLLCDHASNAVPPDINLGIEPALLNKHIAVDIGAAPLTVALAEKLAAPAVLATLSRLVIDLHREPDHPGLVPVMSDGFQIGGNANANRADRIRRFHAPYHAAIAARIRTQRPIFIVAIHSFTAALETGSAPRPWEVGILYNRDARAAAVAIGLLQAAGVLTGDNQPYSGRDLNTTLNRHAEANGIASFAIEVRNNLIDSAQGVARWADILAPILIETRNRLAPKGRPAT